MADNNETGNVGLSGGVGAAIGAVLANGGFGGLGGNNSVMGQIDDRFTSLQGQMATNSLREQGADSTIALGVGIAGVKDAIIASNGQTQLALCGIGHAITSGNAAVIQAVNDQGNRTRELALQTENARLLAQVAQQHNDAGHARTQVMVQALASAGGSGN